MIPYFELTTIEVGSWSLNIWGLLVSSGFLTAIIISYREARHNELKSELILDLAIVIIISAIIGSRLFYVFNEWDQFKDQPINILKIWEGGLAIYGGIVASVLAGWVYLRRRRVSFWKYADVVAYAMPLGLAIGRIGCFMIHDHLGKTTNLPWGFQTAIGKVRHETAMYEILAMVIVFIIFSFIRKKEYFRNQPGRLVIMFFLIYGLFRFFSDMLRATDLPGSDPVLWLGFRPSQIFSLFIIVVSISLIYFWKRKKDID